MKIMIIGSNGQLGWELNRCALKQRIDLISVDLPEFDITDRALVDREINRFDADLLINAAGYTAVDKAESEKEIAFAVNRDGPAFLAAACAARKIPLIHISTDYVFDGTKKGAYVETDPVSPLGVYAKSKAGGEDEIRKILPRHIILRTSWLFCIHGKNFVKTMLRLGREQESVRVVSDQFGCPTYAADLADGILSLIGIGNLNEYHDIQWGTYHYCGGGATSWHGFAETIFRFADKYSSLRVKEVVPINSSEFSSTAKRPPNSVLECSLIKRKFGINTRPWQESLAGMIEELFCGNLEHLSE